MQKKLSVIASLCIIGTITPTLACNGSHVLGAGGSGAIYTLSANTMEEGSYYIGVNVERLSNYSLSDARILEAMQNGADHLHSIDTIDNYSLAFSYGISNNLTLNMQLPYSSRSNIRAGEYNAGVAEVHSHGDVKGLGDLSAVLQYKVYDDAFKVALLAGVKAPTGKTNVEDAGEVLEADLQPGSGSWDIFAGVAVTKDFSNFSIHSDTLYKYNNTGVDNSQLGDILTYNVAISYKLINHKHDSILHKLDEKDEHGYSTDISFELNGEKADEDSFNGVIADNTGHNIVFATVGLQISTESNYSIFFSVSKPIYQDFNGLQNEINYKSSFGIGKSF